MLLAFAKMFGQTPELVVNGVALPRYRKRTGHSVRQGQRVAAKRRRVLRAKGQFKQAVR